jgi:hypothetical protein
LGSGKLKSFVKETTNMTNPNENNAKPWTRVVILVIGLVSLVVASKWITGQFIPSGTKDAIVFQNALLLIVLGSALLEYKFTKPADSAVNGLMGLITLVPVYGLPSSKIWWAFFIYTGAVFVVSMICISASSGPYQTGILKRISEISYRPAIVFGKARVLYSALFIYSIISFYGVQSQQTLILMIFWGVFISLWPLKVPELLSALQTKVRGEMPIGHVIRTDAPNIVHVELSSSTKWEYESIKIMQQGDGKQKYIIPLFSQTTNKQIAGTGLCVAETPQNRKNLSPGNLYEAADCELTPEELLGGDKQSLLIGFVDQNSRIAKIRFHTWNPSDCQEGMLVWSRVGSQKIYYQITEGITEEEGLESNRHGYQTAEAAQLGTLNEDAGFEKFSWLPSMNTPVFSVPSDFGKGLIKKKDSEFEYGHVPGTSISVTGKFTDMMEYHTAILGVTGSGKTELAFDLLRHALTQGTKVICIDLTARYEDRLSDLEPNNLSISSDLSRELSEKLLAVETGQYGAGNEKKALKEFSDQLRADIEEKLKAFLVSEDDDSQIGIITLDEISNTKATIFITELYLTCLLNFARDNSEECLRVLLAVEEAHTVMPEATTMGLGDFDSKGIVAKIAQIALQGRKYGVGLLVIAQRTATVSKTVLTQCNTIISFSCFDETSLNFYRNFYGDTHTAAVPNLRFLQALAFGKGVNSQRPIIFEIPYDSTKDPEK